MSGAWWWSGRSIPGGGPIDEHFDLFSDSFFGFGEGDLLLGQHQFFDAVLFDLVGDLVFHPAHGRAGLGAVGEDAHHVEAEILDEFDQFPCCASVSPGEPAMKVVRMVMPGTHLRSFSSSVSICLRGHPACIIVSI